jgi:LemA protein
MRSPDGAQRNPGPSHPHRDSRIPLHSIRATDPAQMTAAKSDLSATLRQTMEEISMRRLWTVLAVLATLSLTNCGYNAIQTNDEQVKSAWSEVLNQYQRRADLVPNLVNSVKGFAQQEKDVLLGVTNARAKVGSIQATPELINDPGAFAKFQAAQGELTSALSKLLVVTENYPQLKSDALFRDLMSQLEGTENRITVARNRYIKTVQDYNVAIRTFPTNLTAMAFGYKEKANFTVDNEKEISTAPKVDFNPTPAAPPVPAK